MPDEKDATNEQWFLLWMAIVVAAVVFLVATADGGAKADAGDDIDGSSVDVAMSYLQLRQSPRGQGSGWAEGMAALEEKKPHILDEVVFEGTRADALSARQDTRAFDGAPPVIPHAIRQGAVAECLSCHDGGTLFGGRTAPQMSHRELTSCTQCHVAVEGTGPVDDDLEADPREVTNSFVGMLSPERGPRASTIAPPQVPHSGFMRERCDSCHGVNGKDAIRSSHPWRQSCSQCHTTFADVERRPGSDQLDGW
ncbi:MAG: hypothetical protein HN348_05655 [Proteobacteria bacterium]|jgi:nitrate reductase (cytochrome), electron transfer subunit|nr:hypothetical protein [Pseudomonadota bacterium]